MSTSVFVFVSGTFIYIGHNKLCKLNLLIGFHICVVELHSFIATP